MPTVDMLDVREGGVYVGWHAGRRRPQRGDSAPAERHGAPLRHRPRQRRAGGGDGGASARRATSTAVKGNFHDVKALLAERGVKKIDGMMIDLGVSSHQLDTAERGFLPRGRAGLRMDQDQPLTAREIVNTWSAAEITASCAITRRRSGRRASRRSSASTGRAEAAGDDGRSGGVRTRPSPKGAHAGQRATARAARFRRCASRSTTSWTRSKRRWRDMVELLNPGGHLAVLTFHLAGGSHRQADVPAAGESLHLPAENPGVHLRQKAGRARFGRRRNQAGRAGRSSAIRVPEARCCAVARSWRRRDNAMRTIKRVILPKRKNGSQTVDKSYSLPEGGE